MRNALLAFALLAACTCPPPEAPAPAPAPTPPPTEQPPPPPDKPAALPAQGDKCDPAQGCADGAGACVSYFGIAGPSGPEFHSCEIACGEGAPACPDGQQCITIADGPGQVCRPIERPEPSEPAPPPTP
jgi:hypothetical protein